MDKRSNSLQPFISDEEKHPISMTPMAKKKPQLPHLLEPLPADYRRNSISALETEVEIGSPSKVKNSQPNLQTKPSARQLQIGAERHKSVPRPRFNEDS